MELGELSVCGSFDQDKRDHAPLAAGQRCVQAGGGGQIRLGAEREVGQGVAQRHAVGQAVSRLWRHHAGDERVELGRRGGHSVGQSRRRL